jgi:hypothetical protein
MKEPTLAKTAPVPAHDLVAKLKAKTDAVERMIRERDELTREILRAESGSLVPDHEGLRALNLLRGFGLANGQAPEQAGPGVKLAWSLRRHQELAVEIERGRAEEDSLRYDAAAVTGASALQEWNAACAEQAKLLQALDKNKARLFAIRADWVQKTGIASGLPMEGIVLSDDPVAAHAMFDAVQGFAESARSRGNDDGIAKPPERSTPSPFRRKPMGLDFPPETF